MPASSWKLFAAALVTLAALPVLAAPRLCDARSYGAKGDGTTKDTAAIQRAIEACAAMGGTISMTGGTFVAGPLVLKSHTTLNIAVGATLLGSPDHADYPAKDGVPRPRLPGVAGGVQR